MALSDISREAVLAAVAEFDTIGREAFLKKYSFGRAKGYFLVVNGRQYDSKAIVGAAHGYQFPGKPLTSPEFKGGGSVEELLTSLGFTLRGKEGGPSETGGDGLDRKQPGENGPPGRGTGTTTQGGGEEGRTALNGGRDGGNIRLERIKLILEIAGVVVTLMVGIASALAALPGLTAASVAVAVMLIGGITALIWRMK